MGGYQSAHGRPPAFGGSDGRAYTVAPYVDPEPGADGRYGAALMFLRWDAAAGRPERHIETDYLAFGPDPDAALAPLLALSLREVKAHLDHLLHRAGETRRGDSDG